MNGTVTIEKKSFFSSKKFFGTDGKLKKTSYCKKHWIELNEFRQLKEKKTQDLQEEKILLENRLISMPIPVVEKEKLLKKVQLGERKELLKKISESPVDAFIGAAAVQEQITDFLKLSYSFQKISQNIQTIGRRIEDIKDQVKDCLNCKKYCLEHDEEKQKEVHTNCQHCFSLSESFNTKEKKGDTANKVNKSKAVGKQVKKNRFLLQASCPVLVQLREERKKCFDCQKQSQKKNLTVVDNPLKRVFLLAKDNLSHAEIYLLNEDGTACCYGKKDLFHFLTSNDSRTRTLLKDKNKVVRYLEIR